MEGEREGGKTREAEWEGTKEGSKKERGERWALPFSNILI